jgi:hypothetical protein
VGGESIEKGGDSVADTVSGAHPTVSQLIWMPAAVTLAVSLLRLVGELEQWPKPWFNSGAGGAGALVSIAWLPFIFGPYFAFRVRFEIEGPRGMQKWVGCAVLGLAVFTAGVWASFVPGMGPFARLSLPILAATVGAAIQYVVWPNLTRVLLAYGYAARIPVVIVAFLAMRGNWVTHYNASAAFLPPMSFWPRFFVTVVFPQLVGWVGYTALFGSVAGAFAAVLVRRRES